MTFNAENFTDVDTVSHLCMFRVTEDGSTFFSSRPHGSAVSFLSVYYKVVKIFISRSSNITMQSMLCKTMVDANNIYVRPNLKCFDLISIVALKLIPASHMYVYDLSAHLYSLC